ncbi:MAG: 3-oxoacyl-ACP reductase FabG [Burkholderiales bacterium]
MAEQAMPAGRVALVTGASRGIGRAIALELGRLGAIVGGTATSAAGAATIAEYLAQAGIQGAGFAMDVTRADEVERVFGEISARLGEVALLVNNAGITRDNLLLRMREDEWQAVIDTDLTAVYRLCKLAIRPMMKARCGRIVNIASVVGAMGNAGQTNYSAAKAGLIGFTKALAREVGSRGITVNCVAPGFIDTDMTRVLSEAQRAALLAHVPLARFGDAAEVAACVGFLASSGAAYVTGCTLHVNGGMLMD